MPRLVDRAIGATLLVLDDLGMDVEVFRTSGSAVREVLYERHAAYKPTIVTTYLTAPDLAKHYGQGLSRRLGEGTVLVLGGSDG
jgi:DNA replication protein DnaC